METVAVLDFETTGLSPQKGARAIEVAVVLLQGAEIVDRYHSLINSGEYVPPEIQGLTGISNDMVGCAPASARVMREVDEFVGDALLVAHNATFDQKFWEMELTHIGRRRQQEFACTMLLSRRLYKNAQNYKLATIASMLGLPRNGPYHRAQADAELTTHLYLHIFKDVANRYPEQQATHSFLRQIQGLPAITVREPTSRFQGTASSSGQSVPLLPGQHRPVARSPKARNAFEASTSVVQETPASKNPTGEWQSQKTPKSSGGIGWIFWIIIFFVFVLIASR